MFLPVRHSLALSLLTSVGIAAPVVSNPTVTVSQGTIIGTTTTLPSATASVNKYLGIPFAVSPPTRFLPPEAAADFTAPFYAQTTPASCLQQFSFGANEEYIFQDVYTGGPIEESEDCLYLNVYAPGNATSSSKLPVMFWIYGGSLQFGSSGLPAYDGSSFATDQDVIIVTHNYRTNVFGFSNSPEIPLTQQNAGFYDQRLALQWTYDNIAAFGGDPDLITIFGESAGGQSVKQLIAFPPNPLTFAGAIMESEAEFTIPDTTAQWDVLLAQLGCTTLACAQAANATRIKEIILEEPLIFGAVDDGVTHMANPTAELTSGNAAKVPFLIGNNQDEGRAFAYILGLDQPTASLSAFLEKYFADYPALILALEALYDVEDDAYIAISDILTYAEFVCRTSDLVTIAKEQGYSQWRYNFNVSFPNTRTFPDPGAYHASEIPEVFGTYPGNNALGDLTADQVALSQFMQTAWANFAKNPSGGPGWEEYGSSGLIANLGAPANPVGASMISGTEFDAPCLLYAALTAVQGP